MNTVQEKSGKILFLHAGGNFPVKANAEQEYETIDES